MIIVSSNIHLLLICLDKKISLNLTDLDSSRFEFYLNIKT
jgi:hypothetical protein